MKIVPLEPTGNSSKYKVELSKGRGEFLLSFSYTLVNVVWQLQTDEAKFQAAERIALAIVGRHDPNEPFKDKYIFGDHNSQKTVDEMVLYLNKNPV
jgi:hypothetical protein